MARQTDAPGLLGESCRSKGNIVLRLGEQSAARLLLTLVSALPKSSDSDLPRSAVGRSEEKDREFYAAVYETAPEVSLLPVSDSWTSRRLELRVSS